MPDQGKGAGRWDVPAELQKRLGLAPQIDTARAMQLLFLMTDVVVKLDQLGWRLWSELAAASRVTRAADLRAATAEYLARPTTAADAQYVTLLENSRKLVTTLLVALGPGAHDYARDFLHRFGPSAISDLAGLEKRFFESSDHARWRKYAELCKHVTEGSIEDDIRRAVARKVEEMMLTPSPQSES